jgi:tRNA G18 (ribose-2'-O)-methylase SpoU
MEKGNNREIIIIANRIRSLHNVGSVFRTADAIGTTKIYLIGKMATPQNQPKLAKTALGAEKTVAWEHSHRILPILKKLKQDDYEITALELNKNKSIDFRTWNPSKKVAIILGNEISGISLKIQQHCDQVVHLPMLGQKKSLNVSVALGAIAYYLLQ